MASLHPETVKCQPIYDGSAYLKLCRIISGQSVDLEVWNKGQGQREHLSKVSREVADRLEAAGFRSRTGRDISLVGLTSRQILRLESYRDIRLIPEVARRKRRPLLKDLEYYLDRHPFTRMWTFTTGERGQIFELRERLKWLHRKVSKLNATKFMMEYGARIVFRASEFGTIKRAAGGALPSFHPHAHCLVELSEKLTKARWSELLHHVNAYWNFCWDESGRIRKRASEVVKYVAKPNDLLKLKGSELVYLQTEVIARSRMTDTLGSLRLEREVRNSNGLRVDKGNGLWRVSPRWNHGKPKRPGTLQQFEEHLGRKATIAELGQLRVNAPSGGLRSPMVLARCLPSPVFSPVREPVFLVEGLDSRLPGDTCDRWKVDWVLGQPEARQVLWAIRFNTTSLTVRRKAEEKGEERKKERALAYDETRFY